MAMNGGLIILIAEEYAARPEVEALRAKGHTVYVYDNYVGGVNNYPVGGVHNYPDLILHPAAHAWDDSMWGKPSYLENAIKRARKRKKEAQ